MSGGREVARNLFAQEPGRGSRFADATGTPKLAPGTAKRQKRAGLFTIETESGTVIIHVTGREAWALERLAAAGPTGCTPITEPAPRWSAYIYRLRGRGLPIETIREPHGGTFPGHHARYVLHARVEKGGGA